MRFVHVMINTVIYPSCYWAKRASELWR